MPTTNFWVAFGASSFACLVTCTGLATLRMMEDWAREKVPYFMSFACGTMISVSFLHLIPTAFKMSAQAPVYLLLGFFALHGLNRFLASYVCDKGLDDADAASPGHCPDYPHDHFHGHAPGHIQEHVSGQAPAAAAQGAKQSTVTDHAAGLLPLISIGFHSFVDGIMYSITFSVSIFTGLLSAIGLILHEFPEGIITYIFLTHAGFSKKRSMVLSVISAALTTPFGMLVSYPFIHKIGDLALGNLLGLSAGALIYTGGTHLLPKTEHANAKYSILAMISGVLIALFVLLTE